jgi:hypothetical protein
LLVLLWVYVAGPCRRAEQLVAQAVVADFNASAFEKELVEFAGTEEYIIRGGREKFKNLPQAMKVRHQWGGCGGLVGRVGGGGSAVETTAMVKLRQAAQSGMTFC